MQLNYTSQLGRIKNECWRHFQSVGYMWMLKKCFWLSEKKIWCKYMTLNWVRQENALVIFTRRLSWLILTLICLEHGISLICDYFIFQIIMRKHYLLLTIKSMTFGTFNECPHQKHVFIYFLWPTYIFVCICETHKYNYTLDISSLK